MKNVYYTCLFCSKWGEIYLPQTHHYIGVYLVTLNFLITSNYTPGSKSIYFVNFAQLIDAT